MRTSFIPIRKKSRVYAVVYPLLLVLCAISLFPVAWMILSSLKEATEIYTVPPQFFPSVLVLKHYVAVFNDPRVVRYFINSSPTIRS